MLKHHSTMWKRWGLAMLAASVLLFPNFAEAFAPPAPPDVVRMPAGIDLGGSSFYDGFGDPGWTIINYDRFEHLTSIKDADGKDSPLFHNPRIDVYTHLFHLIYMSPIDVFHGGFGVDALFPLVNFQSHFQQPGVELKDNGFNIGDLTFGPFFQSKPTIVGHRPVLSWRAEFEFVAPIGGFNETADINQSSGFWSLIPYLAVTTLPLPKWEVSARFNYIYNMSTSTAPNPPPIPGFTFQNGQAGQAVWINFDSSYEIAYGVSPGINGFWLQQFTNDVTNGVTLPNTRQEQLYLGPGVSWELNRKNIFQFNVYLPIANANVATGRQFNFRFIHEL